MGDQMVTERPIVVLRAGVDAIGTVDPADLSDVQLAGEVLRLRREMTVSMPSSPVSSPLRMPVVWGLAMVTNQPRRGCGGRPGCAPADVRAAIDAGALAEVLPETTLAWRNGQITTGAMRAIDGARVDGFDTELAAVEPELLDAALRKDMWSLQRMTALFRACAKRDGDLPADRSGLRAAIVGDRLVLDGEIGGLAGETIQRVLNAFTDPPSADDDRNLGQRRADALYRICRIALDAGVDANMGSLNAAVVVDWTTLLAHLAHLAHKHSAETGQSAAGEPAASAASAGWSMGRMDGGFIGPIDPTDIETLLCDCAISRVVTGPNSETINVGRSQRAFSTGTRRAIIIRDQHCRWPGCEKPPGWCEAHHVQYWENGGASDLANGVLLCSRHHRFLHQHPDWQIDWDQTNFRVYRPDGTELAPLDQQLTRPARRPVGVEQMSEPPSSMK